VETLERDDIQGFLRHGYPYFDAAAYCIFRIDDAAGAKRWLEKLLDPGEPWIDQAQLPAERLKYDDCGVALAFTACGLHKLGLGEDTLRTFPSEFQEGMAVEHRARLLGDEGVSHPAGWDWGGKYTVDGLLMVFSGRTQRDDQFVDEAGRLNELNGCVAEIKSIPGCPQFVHRLTGMLNLNPATGVGKEPFGFADGISQPFIEGLTLKKPPRDVRAVKAGEFVLGYLNEFNRYPASPSVADATQVVLPPLGTSGRADFGRNGTFLVMRQLEQNVAAFERFVNGDECLAARMVGRWKSGAPLVRHLEEPPQKKTQRELEAQNDFGYYREDRHGFRCPIGAHIRRANPRDSLAGGLGIAPEEAQAMVDQHRILRRGRGYNENGKQGLVFICLNANLERQFEFVQNSWVMHPEFGGLHDETDPLLGNAPRDMTIQQPLLGRRIGGLGQFVKVRGGEYFFLPGLKALKYLSQLPAK
jgi:Dyp-type peroxidase family